MQIMVCVNILYEIKTINLSLRFDKNHFLVVRASQCLSISEFYCYKQK